MARFIFLLVALIASVTAEAAEWRNLESGCQLGGRKSSGGYLQGKVVLVCRWSVTNKTDSAFLARMEDIWESFKTKQFVVLGGPLGDIADTNAVKQALAAEKTTFPVYAGAGLAAREPKYKSLPTLYVVDETGLVIYVGKDDRMATQAIVQSLTDMDAPRNVKQWKRFLDYELEHLPAHALVRLKAFNKQFPKDAASYLAQAKELTKLPDVKKVADLVEFAKRAKDPPQFGSKEKAKRQKYEQLVRDVLEKCLPLKDAADPRLAQEAKNALADLKWAQASF